MAEQGFFKWVWLGATLLGPAASHAQALPPDSAARAPCLLLKAGLRLTRLHYVHDGQTWQLLVPLSLGAEYRLAPRLSLYGIAEADLTASRTAYRRRNARNGSVSAADGGLGARYYYGRPRAGHLAAASPEFGKYLALESGAAWQQLAITGASRRNVPASLTPSVFARWGIQNRLLPHLLYDLDAGLGVLAPAHYYHFERARGAAHWNMGAQVNIRLYFGN